MRPKKQSVLGPKVCAFSQNRLKTAETSVISGAMVQFTQMTGHVKSGR